ncbi:MAG: hypothetical protein PF961_18545 [Planctomycetota bacterium]|jgi:hypothetical protein|nr:hypothetical protein [Planctomycetota bacterium]
MRYLAVCVLLSYLGLLSAATRLWDDERRGVMPDVPMPSFVDESEAVAMVTKSESAIVYFAPRGLESVDAIWTAGAIALAATVPVVELVGGALNEQAKAWGIKETPAIALVDSHGNCYHVLQGGAAKPAAVENAMRQASGMIKKVRADMAKAVERAVAGSSNERKLPASITSLQQVARFAGLPEAAAAKRELDVILAKGLDELREIAAAIRGEERDAMRRIAKFERNYANTPLIAQAKRVREGKAIGVDALAEPEPVAAEEPVGGVDLLGGP